MRIRSTVPDPDLTIRRGGGGGGHPDPEIMGGADLPKIFWSENKVGAHPAGPCPGFATGQTSTTGYLP